MTNHTCAIHPPLSSPQIFWRSLSKPGLDARWGLGRKSRNLQTSGRLPLSSRVSDWSPPSIGRSRKMTFWDTFVDCRQCGSHADLTRFGRRQNNRGVRVEELAGATGLEPAASCVTGQRSNQLNYAPAYIAPILPDCSLPFPPLPICVRNCPKVP